MDEFREVTPQEEARIREEEDLRAQYRYERQFTDPEDWEDDEDDCV